MDVSMLKVEEPVLSACNPDVKVIDSQLSPDYDRSSILIKPINQSVAFDLMPHIPGLKPIQPLLENSLKTYYINNSKNIHE